MASLPKHYRIAPQRPVYGYNLKMEFSDWPWKRFFHWASLRWVRLILWTKACASPSSSRAILTSRHQPDSDPHILFFEAPNGVFIANIQKEVKEVLGAPEYAQDVRWNRWLLEESDWDVSLDLGVLLHLAATEHTVVGRLEGVTGCKGLGQAIRWAETPVNAPTGITDWGWAILDLEASLNTPSVDEVKDENAAADNDAPIDDTRAFDDDDGVLDAEAETSTLEQGGERVRDSEGSSPVAGPSNQRRHIERLTAPSRVQAATLAPVQNQEGGRSRAGRQRAKGPVEIIDLTHLSD